MRRESLLGRMSLMNKFYDTFFHLCLGALNWLQNILCNQKPDTYLVKAGWPVVLKKMCHWKEADTTICICCGANQEPGDPNESDDSWTSQQVSAGWAKVMTVTIPHFRHHHMKYIKKTVRSIEHVWRTMAAERCYICGHCNDCVVNLEYAHPADWLEDLSALTEMLELRSCPWRCPDKDRPQ